MVNPDDLLIYVYDKKEARYTDLIKQFVDSKKLAKATLLNYKTRLEAEGRIRKRISTTTNRPVYYVPKENVRKVEELKAKQEIKTKIDQMTPEKIRELTEFLDFLVSSKEGEEFWVWLPDIDHPEKIKKFKHITTKNLSQD